MYSTYSTTEFKEELRALIAARYPLIYLVSFEEQRIEEILLAIGREMGKKLVTWTITQGLVQLPGRKPLNNTADPIKALDAIRETPPEGTYLYVLKDFHPFLNDVTVVRQVRDTVYHLMATNSSLFILSPVTNIPKELEKIITLIDCPLPTSEDFEMLLHDFQKRYGCQASFNLDGKDREAIVKNLLGLTRTEAENILARVLVKDRRLSAEDLPLIIKEKEQIIRRSGILEYIPLKENFTRVGGLNNLKKWLENKRKIFDDAAREFGVDTPKGVLLIGVPGCGKSLTAKAVAGAWTIPLIRFDLGKVFGMYVGQSEENIRNAIKTAESVAPCVLWIDELEKAVAGTGSGGNLDSGVTSRVFGTFITWLNERSKPVFVVATANDIRYLPPELMRKGRFDEIFFVDLPNQKEREEIFAVQLYKRRRNPSDFDLKHLAAISEGFTGSDIEGVVKAAIEKSYIENMRQLTTDDLAFAIGETIPLSTTMKEKIETLRKWAQSRARPASTPWEQVPVPSLAQDTQQRRIEL